MLKRTMFTCFVFVILASGIPAQATTLLSNLDNVSVGPYSGDPDSADHFRTGTEPVTVAGINVLCRGLGSVPGVNRVLIYTDVSGFPSGVTVGTPFTNPAVTFLGRMLYSGVAELSPNTVYWMVLDISDVSKINYTFATNYVADSSTGGAQMLERSAWGDNDAVSWSDDQANLMYEVIGIAGQGGIFADGFEVGGTGVWSTVVP